MINVLHIVILEAQENVNNHSNQISQGMTKTAIIYSSKYGTTEKVAKMIAEKIAGNNEVTLIALNDDPKPDISTYNKVILGTSIYKGKPRSNMKDFYKNNQATFENKIIGLFICGGATKEQDKQKELKNAYPGYLHKVAIAESFIDGEYQLDKMSTIEKIMIRMKEKVKESVSNLDYDAIDVFSSKMK